MTSIRFGAKSILGDWLVSMIPKMMTISVPPA